MGLLEDLQIVIKIGPDLVPIYKDLVTILQTSEGKRLVKNIGILVSALQADNEGKEVNVKTTAKGKYEWDSLEGWVWHPEKE